MAKNNSIIPAERLERIILVFRGQKVMLDADLAELYGVETGALIQAVKRNRDRFPDDFMFELSYEEVRALTGPVITVPATKTQDKIPNRPNSESFQPNTGLISQSVISNSQSTETTDNSNSELYSTGRRGGRRKLPYVFTEQGVAMLSSVLNSPRAVQVNIEVMRAFVRLRQLISSNTELAHQLEQLELKYDGQFRVVFAAIKQLMTPPPPPLPEPQPEPKKKGKLGFGN